MKRRELKRTARGLLCGKYGLLLGAQLLSFALVLLCALAAAICLLFGIGVSASLANSGAWVQAGNGLSVTGTLNRAVQLGAGINAALAALFVVFLLLAIVLWYLFTIGLTKLLLNICRKAPYGIRDLFYGFRRGSHPLRVLGVGILSFLIALLLLLLYAAGCFVILGVGESAAAFCIWYLVWLLLLCYVSYGIGFAPMIIIDRPKTRVREALSLSWRMMRRKRWKLFLLGLSFLFWNIPIYLTGGLAGLWILPYIGTSMILFYLDAAGELPVSLRPVEMETVYHPVEVEEVSAPDTEKTGPGPETKTKTEAETEEVPQEEPGTEGRQEAPKQEETGESTEERTEERTEEGTEETQE